MPLILAIVADPHEAAQLAQLIEGRLSVDLVQAAEVGEGLLALDERVPDLILTSPLMSPFDDGVLDEYLRDLGPAGAHVQTLRIPVLSQAPRKRKRLGFSLRRSKPEAAATLEGCEPKVFADEIAQYLARAVEEKRHVPANGTRSVKTQEVEPDEPAISEEKWSPAYLTDAPTEYAAWSRHETEAEQTAWSSDPIDGSAAEEATKYDEAAIDAPVETVSQWEEQPPAAAAEPESADPVVEAVQTEVRAEPGITFKADVRSAPHPTYPEPEVRLKPDTTHAVPDVGLKPDTTYAAPDARLKPDTTDSEHDVRLKPDTSSPKPDVTFAAKPIAQTGFRPRAEPIEEVPADVVSGSSQTRVDDSPVPELPGALEEDTHSIKSSASFKAALEAIRAAWGKPPSTTASLDKGTSEKSPLPSKSTQSAPPATTEQESPETAETPGPFEVDLTGAVETLDEPIVRQAITSDRAAHARVTARETADVYELSVEPDLRQLESKLLTRPAPSQTKRDAKPAAESRAIEAPPAPPLSEPRGDRRKKSSKRTAKAAKSRPARQQPPQPQVQPQAVQDEWGMFDPKQCGFAALVDELDKVSDEKKEQRRKGSKVRVISYS